jgi:tRNA U34 5-carboxymethylaminomethyl modifying GTPase MnmE/TrmE
LLIVITAFLSILAVMSCLAGGSTDNILKVVRDADPEGTRTIGVLTKADLVHDTDVFRTLHELVSGSSLPLGYFVVRNRGTGEDNLSLDQCKNKERQLFQKPEWAAIAALRRTGVDTLRNELRRLVANLDRQELLRQSIKLTAQLEDSRKALDEMGFPVTFQPASGSTSPIWRAVLRRSPAMRSKDTMPTLSSVRSPI